MRYRSLLSTNARFWTWRKYEGERNMGAYSAKEKLQPAKKGRPWRFQLLIRPLLCGVASRTEMSKLRCDLVLHLSLCLADKAFLSRLEFLDVIFSRSRSVVLVLLESRCCASPKHPVLDSLPSNNPNRGKVQDEFVDVLSVLQEPQSFHGRFRRPQSLRKRSSTCRQPGSVVSTTFFKFENATERGRGNGKRRWTTEIGPRCALRRKSVIPQLLFDSKKEKHSRAAN